MAEQAQNRVQQAIKEFVNEVDETHLRPMERNMHLCAADCCGKKNATIDEVHRYIPTIITNQNPFINQMYLSYCSVGLNTNISFLINYFLDVLNDAKKAL